MVVADPADCHFQFDVTGKAKAVSSCDIARNALATSGVSYTSQAAAVGASAYVRIGDVIVPSNSGRGFAPPALKAMTADFEARLGAALSQAGYPSKADPARRNTPLLLAALLVLTIAATALYGPMAAALTELFPAKVRYTAMSLPYHLGTGWIGGFQPVASFAIVVATGNIYAGLAYPFVFTAISVAASMLFLPETRGRSLEA